MNQSGRPAEYNTGLFPGVMVAALVSGGDLYYPARPASSAARRPTAAAEPVRGRLSTIIAESTSPRLLPCMVGPRCSPAWMADRCGSRTDHFIAAADADATAAVLLLLLLPGRGESPADGSRSTLREKIYLYRYTC